MKNRSVLWLHQELPKLIEKGILSEENAAQLRDYYGPPKCTSVNRIILALFAILAAACIGCGIILILAHNWDQLGRPARTIISFTPLLAGQILTAFVLAKKRHSIAWREGVGLFAGISIGACIALIGQTYHIPGDFTRFMLVWLLLGIPLIYLLNNTSLALLALVGLTSWIISHRIDGGNTFWYFPVLALLIPHFYAAYRPEKSVARQVLYALGLTLHFLIALGVIMVYRLPGLWIPAYAGLLTCFIVLGLKHNNRAGFTVMCCGSLGILVMALMLTYDGLWNDISFHGWQSALWLEETVLWQEFSITLLLLATPLVYGYHVLRKGQGKQLLWLSGYILICLCYILRWVEMPVSAAQLIMNLLIFLAGLYAILHGMRVRKLLQTNVGMAILSVLLIARFFDSELSFVMRGSVFIIVGVGFLGINLFLTQLARKEEGAVS